jgi:chemotaxis protein CheX
MKPNLSEVISNSVKEVLADLCQCEIQTGKAKMRNISQTLEEITILLEVSGKLKGQILYIMEKSFALELASIMIGMPIINIDELSMSALSEIGNIITGNAMTKISELGYYCETNIPVVITGKDKPLPVNDPLGSVIPGSTPIGNFMIGLSIREN